LPPLHPLRRCAFLPLLLLVPPVQAVRAQETPAPPVPAISPPPAPAQSPDLLPLKKALFPLSGEGLLQSDSNLQMSGSKQGLSFTFREEVKVIAKRPNRFRAELTQFSAAGVPQQKLLVVSDGSRVWTYRPGTRRYSVRSFAAFEAADDDITALGLTVGGFFIGDAHVLAQALRMITRDNSAEFLAGLKQTGATISSRAESADGHDSLVYRMTLGQQGLAYRFTVDPATNRLTQADLSGAQKGTQFGFKETLVRLQVPATTPLSTFRFTPSPGAVKASDVPVDPF
jgi:outer membrane lipoprotein-sorting protein